MSSALYQSIEALSREKSIDPMIVVSAVEEAIALATRKYYKTQENMRGELNKDTGEITVYSYKTVMGEEELIEDPVNQITLEEAQALAEGAELEPGSEIRLYKDTRPLGRIARAAGQAGNLPEGPRGGTRYRLQRIRSSRKRSVVRRRQAHRGSGHDHRPWQS